MKKLLIALTIILALTLSGCGEQEPYDEFSVGIKDEVEYTCWKEGNNAITRKFYCDIQDKYKNYEVEVTKARYYNMFGRLFETEEHFYYTQEEVDELLEDYVSMEELDELFEDFGGLEQFINDFDNWEDIVNAHINE